MSGFVGLLRGHVLEVREGDIHRPIGHDDRKRWGEVVVTVRRMPDTACAELGVRSADELGLGPRMSAVVAVALPDGGEARVSGLLTELVVRGDPTSPVVRR